MIPLFQNNPNLSYLEILKRMYEYNNVHSSNAKLERMFSRMALAKTDWLNRLNRRNLDALLQIGEEGPEIDLDANESIDPWFTDRVCMLSSKNHSYPEKHFSVVDIAILALSDLEDDESQGSRIRGTFMKHFLKYCESIFP